MNNAGRGASPKAHGPFSKRFSHHGDLENALSSKLLGSNPQSPGKVSPTFKSSNGISSKHIGSMIETSQHSSAVQKFLHMEGMVVQLLDQHPLDNREINNDGLIYLLSIIRNITKEKHKQGFKTKSQIFYDDKKQLNTLVDESTKVNSTLTKLIEISKSREIKDSLNAMKQIQDKVMREIDNIKSVNSPRLEYGERIRESYREGDLEIMKLKQQKIELMAQLNRQIDRSNKKTEQINFLESKIYKLQKEQPSRLVRCFSSTLSPPSHQMTDKSQISHLLKQNELLKKQINQMKQFSISESFISEAFNFRDKQLSNQKTYYQNIIKQLKAQISQLQYKVSRNNSHKKSTSDVHYFGQSKNNDSQIRKIEEQKGKMAKQLEHYKDCCRSLRQEIIKLKSEAYELAKSPVNKSKYNSPDYRKMKFKTRQA